MHSTTQGSMSPCLRFIGDTQRLGAPARQYRDPLPDRPQRRKSLYFRAVTYSWQHPRDPIGSPCCCPFLCCHVATRAGSISLRGDSKDARCSTFRSIRSQCQRRFFRNRHLPSWQLNEQRTATPKVAGYSLNGGAFGDACSTAPCQSALSDRGAIAVRTSKAPQRAAGKRACVCTIGR